MGNARVYTKTMDYGYDTSAGFNVLGIRILYCHQSGGVGLQLWKHKHIDSGWHWCEGEMVADLIFYLRFLDGDYD